MLLYFPSEVRAGALVIFIVEKISSIGDCNTVDILQRNNLWRKLERFGNSIISQTFHASIICVLLLPYDLCYLWRYLLVHREDSGACPCYGVLTHLSTKVSALLTPASADDDSSGLGKTLTTIPRPSLFTNNARNSRQNNASCSDIYLHVHSEVWPLQ